jgi:hypothetical protein
VNRTRSRVEHVVKPERGVLPLAPGAIGHPMREESSWVAGRPLRRRYLGRGRHPGRRFIEGVGKGMSQFAEVHVYEIGCPRCSAGPGVACSSPAGVPIEFPHRERNQAIREREAKNDEANGSRRTH